MKRSVARKWIKALESGEYSQGIHRLRSSDKWCCLGVLCNLHAQEHPEIAATQKLKWVYLGESTVLPKEVMVWSGMDSDIGSISYGENLAKMNDSGMTFQEISKVIRKHWKEL
jgi:hypothetical protein